MFLAALLALAPVTLRWSPVVDGRAVYSIKAVIELGGDDDVRFTGTSTERVKSLEAGLVTTAVETAISVDVLGVVRQGRPLASERVERLDGTLVTAAKVDGTLLFATPRVDRLRTLFLPTTPVEIGSGWWRMAGAGDAPKAPPFSCYYKLEGAEKVAGHDAWRVSMDANEVDDDHPVHVKGMVWLDKTDGALVRGQWTIAGFTYSATSPPGNARFELLRVDQTP